MDPAVSEAERFLAPILSRAGQKDHCRSIIQALSPGDDDLPQGSERDERDSHRRRLFIDKALGFVGNLHKTSVESPTGFDQLEALAYQRTQKVVHTLLDLIVLEGIYPSLSTGVGVPLERRLKSTLKGGLTTRSLNEATSGLSRDKQTLMHIVECLCPMFLSRTGLAFSMQERISVDLIAGVGELAFSPTIDVHVRPRFARNFKDILGSKSALDLFPILTSLLHPSCPDWFRSPISSCLSLLPLRPDGVRQTINFIASTSSGEHSVPFEHGNPSTGPTISLEALARTSKLLTSVPSSMTPDSWTAALAPQLLDLLDDAMLDNRRIASYIIGTGFLCKRKLGAPGTAGWKSFVEPILTSLDPPIERCPVSETDLKLALDRFSTLVHFHSNSGLTKRLISPVLLPLWGLECYARETRRTSWVDQVHQILSTYMKISATESQMLLLSANLLWRGTGKWQFEPGANGGIGIGQRDGEIDDSSELTKIVDSIDYRVSQYLSLLKAAIVTDDQLGKITSQASKCWLVGAQPSSEHETLGDRTRSPIDSLAYAKLTMRLLEDFKARNASSFEGIIQLIDTLLSTFVAGRQRFQKRRQNASLPSLAHIDKLAGNVEKDVDDADDLDTIVSTALGLLSTLLSSSDELLRDADPGLLNRLQESLKYIALAQTQDIDLTKTASNVLMLLQLHREAPNALITKSDPTDNHVLTVDLNNHRKALGFLTDELAPVRAQGLSALHSLVAKASPILDIASTAILLTSLLQDEDEYIYLSAIKTLGLLASNHPKTVVGLLVERYVDQHEESTLDVRIKVGEALNKTIEHLGQMFNEEIAKLVGENMIAVAGRRGNRPKTQRQRERAKRKAEKEAKKDAEADGPWAEALHEDSDDGNDPEQQQQINAHTAHIIAAWSSTGLEEDTRIRASALSILGTAIETNIAGLGATITSTAIDCALAILKLETSADRAILRAAAVMVVMSVVRAVDAAEEGGRRLGFGFEGEGLGEVVTVLRYVEVGERDEVVRGHVRDTMEGLEAWRQKSLLGFPRRERGGLLDVRVGVEGLGELDIGSGRTTVSKIEEVN